MSDILNIDKINSIAPIMGKKNYSVYDIEKVCVETGVCNVNVSGLNQLMYWFDFEEIIDWNENSYCPDSVSLDEGLE